MKRFLSVVLCIAMLMSLAVVVNAEGYNPSGGLKTEVTVKKADHRAVVKDGIIGEGEYTEVEINRDPETTDLLFTWFDQSEEVALLRAEAEKLLQNVHYYYSWDEVNGLNIAVKATLLETPYCEGEMPAPGTGDDFIWQFGMMASVVHEDDPETKRKNEFQNDVINASVGYNTVTNTPLVGDWGCTGYADAVPVFEEGVNYSASVNGNEVVFEISYPINVVLDADNINGNIPNENAYVYTNVSVVSGNAGKGQENARTYAVSLGDYAFMFSKFAGDKLLPAKAYFSYEEIPYTPPHVHDYAAVVTAPTCTEGGYTTYTCECGDNYVADEVSANGHALGEWEAVGAPVCETAGSEIRYCANCDYSETRDTEALGHDIVSHEAKAPTCTEAGWNAYEECTRCDYTTFEGEIPATGHSFGDWEEVESATCTDAGSEKKVCACGKEETRVVEAYGHDYGDWYIDIEATETTLGEKSKYCGRCGDRIEVTVIPTTKDWIGGFTDLTTDWYKPYVGYAVANGYMSGTSGTTFNPMMNMDRRMVVKVLHNMAGAPEHSGENPFTDLEANQTWYHDAVIWAAENKIVSGRGGGIFDPTAPVTRQELAMFLYNYAKYMGYDVNVEDEYELDFPDADTTAGWATTAVKWAVSRGLISGKSNNGVLALAPTATATRAEVAVVLSKFDSNVNLPQ